MLQTLGKFRKQVTNMLAALHVCSLVPCLHLPVLISVPRSHQAVSVFTSLQLNHGFL